MVHQSCGHLPQNAHDRPAGEPVLVNRRSPVDRPDYPAASRAPASGSRWSYRDDGPRYRIACGTAALTYHRYGVLSASHVTGVRSLMLCAHGSSHAVLGEYCGAQAYNSSCTCRPSKKVSPPHACTVCRRGRYNVPSNRILLTTHRSNYTRRLFGGRQPLCGIGVTSMIDVIFRPADCNERIAASRPEPGPLTNTSICRRPCSIALRAADSAVTCAA